MCSRRILHFMAQKGIKCVGETSHRDIGGENVVGIRYDQVFTLIWT
jgi:hypothetical protein